MNIKGIILLISLIILSLLSCDPKDDPIECFPDSIHNLDGIIYNGHITLCNAQGPDLRYETAICSLTVRPDSVIFTIFSTNPDYYYYYRDTLTSDCVILEETERVFNFYEFSSSDLMGTIHENNNTVHIIINDSICPTSSVFEGNQ